MVQRQHDGADHGDEQDQTGGLKQIHIFRVEDQAERPRVAHIGRRRRLRRDLGCGDPGRQDEHQLDQHDDANGGADGKEFEEAGFQRREIHVEHHHHEEEQHHDRADIDHDQDHGDELGAEQHEQSRRVEEGKDEEQHGVHRIAHGDDHEGRRHADPGEKIEEERRQRHAASRDLERDRLLFAHFCAIMET